MRRYWPHEVMRWALLVCLAGGVLMWGCGGPPKGETPTGAGPASVPNNADTVGLYGPAKGTFMLTSSRHPNTVEKTFAFGPTKASMVAIAGDWNADRADEVGVYDPQASTFYLAERGSGKAAAKLPWGEQNAGWLPIAGDWDGDGRDGVGLYDPAQGMFRLRNSTSGQASELKVRFGPRRSKWLPIAGDWDGDGKDTVGLYDPPTRIFRLINSFEKPGGKSYLKFSVYGGQAGALSVVGEWDGDGKDTVGWYDGASSTFYIKNANRGGAPDVKIRLGVKGEKLQPIAGRW